MLIEEWIEGYMVLIVQRLRPPDWPISGSEEWEAYRVSWKSAFARNGVSKSEAWQALHLVEESPPQFKRDYIPVFLEAVKGLRPSSQPAASSIEAAKLASKGCVYCGPEQPSGFACVFHPRPDPANRIPATVAAFCVCPLGRFNLECHTPESRRAFADVARILSGQSGWLLDRPHGVRCDGYPDDQVPDWKPLGARQGDLRPFLDESHQALWDKAPAALQAALQKLSGDGHPAMVGYAERRLEAEVPVSTPASMAGDAPIRDPS